MKSEVNHFPGERRQKMTTETGLRNGSLEQLRDLLMDQHARKVDIVAPATAISARDGQIVVKGADPVLEDNGVTPADGVYDPTDVFLDGLAAKLSIPGGYLRRMFGERPDLFDSNVNGWLRGRRALVRQEMMGPHAGEYTTLRKEIPADPRSFMVRAFRSDSGTGVARAFLSDRYGVTDNLDALVAALDGVKQAGHSVDIEACDLTDRRMYVKLRSDAVSAMAPELLADYKSPFSGLYGADNPLISAGLVISNSEVGDGAFTITPRLVVQVCSNGMTVTKDAFRSVHLGARMDEGVIRWSEDSQQKNLSLITARARDSVATFLDIEYVKKVIREKTELAGKPIEQPEKVIMNVVKSLQFSKETADAVFGMFIKGGDLTAGGVMHAITAQAQVETNADVAADLENRAFDALELAARHG
jgi:hypothetical protein